MNYYVYDIDSGEVIHRMLGPLEQLNGNVLEGQSVIAREDIMPPSKIYAHHETGTLHEKADYTLDAIPLPATITIEGVSYEVTEQPTFEFDTPGVYIIQVDAGPHFLKKEFEIDYQPPEPFEA